MSEIYIFPNPRTAAKDAPLCSGANLAPKTILSAYKHGIFPWFVENEPILWWSPDPRAVLFPRDVKIQKSIRPYLKKYSVKFDHNFENFIKFCQNGRKHEPTWISDDIVKAYTKLANLGIAHSVEVFFEDELIGGLYGIILGRVFCGESMISLKPNASKVALITLCKTLEKFDFIIDCQIMNPHLKFMGAINLKRDEFLEIYQKLSNQNSGFSEFANLIPLYK